MARGRRRTPTTPTRSRGREPRVSAKAAAARRVTMRLAALCTLLASSSALHPGARPRLREASCGESSVALSPDASPRLCRRQALCGAAAAALSLTPAAPAFADYGQAATQKLPAFVPSPIRPTGEMAKTCEIVALGREVAAARSKGF